jgi:hypothetical protein
LGLWPLILFATLRLKNYTVLNLPTISVAPKGSRDADNNYVHENQFRFGYLAYPVNLVSIPCEFDTLNWPQIDILFWPHLGRVNILTVKDFFKTVAKI